MTVLAMPRAADALRLGLVALGLAAAHARADVFFAHFGESSPTVTSRVTAFTRDGSTAIVATNFGFLVPPLNSRWTRAGGLVPIENISPQASLVFTAVSDDARTLVGYAYVPGGIHHPVRPVRHTSAGTQLLGPLSDFDLTRIPRAVSADGRIAAGSGAATLEQHYATRALVWPTPTTVAELPSPPYPATAVVYAMSASGARLAGGYEDPDANFLPRACYWDGVQPPVTLDPGSPFGSIATAITSDASMIVGAAADAVASRAFQWTQATGMRLLDLGEGMGEFTSPSDVSADGRVMVGTFFRQANFDITPFGTLAFYWDRSGRRYLGDVLRDAGLDVEGYVFEQAPFLSDDGLTIAGTANGEGFVARIPAPAPAALLLLALAAHARRFDRRGHRRPP